MVSCSLDIHPALIAAIISRQSEAGTNLNGNGNGYGRSDPNCYGLMQVCVDKYFFQPALRGHLLKFRVSSLISMMWVKVWIGVYS